MEPHLCVVFPPFVWRGGGVGAIGGWGSPKVWILVPLPLNYKETISIRPLILKQVDSLLLTPKEEKFL